jgi:hypothetical protein
VQADVKLTHGVDREVVLCHTKTSIAVPDAILLESAMPTNGVAVAVLHSALLGRAARPHQKGLHAMAGFSKKRFSPESLAARVAPSFF